MTFILTNDLDLLRLWPLQSHGGFYLFSYLQIGAHVLACFELVEIYILHVVVNLLSCCFSQLFSSIFFSATTQTQLGNEETPAQPANTTLVEETTCK